MCASCRKQADEKAILLEQMWDLGGNKGHKLNSDGSVSLTAARSEFLSPQKWKRIQLPYKVSHVDSPTFVCGLQRPGLVAKLSITHGGQMNVNILNSTSEVVHLTPKTTLVNILGAHVSVQEFGKEARRLVPYGTRRKRMESGDFDGRLSCNEAALDSPSGADVEEGKDALLHWSKDSPIIRKRSEGEISQSGRSLYSPR